MRDKIIEKEIHRLEKERGEFHKLLAVNPNYFGTLAGSSFKPVKKIIGNTKYE